MGARKRKWISVIEVLYDHDVTARELSEQAGIALSQARMWLNDMQAAKPRLAHIVEWRRTITNNPSIPVYSFGPGVNVRRPQKQTQAERQKALRTRKMHARLCYLDHAQNNSSSVQ